MRVLIQFILALAWCVLLTGLSTYSLITTAAVLPNVAAPTPSKESLDYGLKATKLAGGWYVIAGANADFTVENGCNIINTGFYIEEDRVWVINTGTSKRYGEQQNQLIQSISGSKKVEQVIALNLHPDYFMGNQAYSDQVLWATQKTISGIKAEGPSYEDNLYRLCGDWMKATEMVAPTHVIKTDQFNSMGSKALTVLELAGHTDSDLVLFDAESGVLWAGGLVFHNRIVTTPHANLKVWLESLKQLKTLDPKVIVPSHGPVAWGTGAIDQTIDYVSWLDHHLQNAAESGLTMNELLEMGVPERFKGFAAYPAEYLRNLTHLYPTYEKKAFSGF